MEQKLENETLAEETLNGVSGGIVDNAATLGAAQSILVTQQNLDVAHNLIGSEKTAGVLGFAPTDQVEDKNFALR